MLNWVAKRLKHVWDKPLSKRGTHALIKHDWYAAVQMNKNIAHQTREQKKCYVFDRMFDGLQILSNTIKQYQTRCPNGKVFVHQTMFDGVW